MKNLNQFNVPRFSDLEQDYAHQEVMEYKQFAVFLATTQLLVNYTHVREKRRMLKACTVSVWQIMFMLYTVPLKTYDYTASMRSFCSPHVLSSSPPRQSSVPSHLLTRGMHWRDERHSNWLPAQIEPGGGAARGKEYWSYESMNITVQHSISLTQMARCTQFYCKSYIEICISTPSEIRTHIRCCKSRVLQLSVQ